MFSTLIAEAELAAAELAAGAQAATVAEGSSGNGLMQKAQLFMVAGFLMLGWVLARRQLKMRKHNRANNREANRELERVRSQQMPSMPLADAPVETQRWQAAMFDLQRELTAELDTRIATVDTLIHQLDDRIATLESAGVDVASLLSGRTAGTGLERDRVSPGPSAADLGLLPPGGEALRQLVAQKRDRGQTSAEIAAELSLPVGEIEWTMATMP